MLKIIFLNILRQVVDLNWREHCAEREDSRAVFDSALTVKGALCVHQNNCDFTSILVIVQENVRPHVDASCYPIGSTAPREAMKRLVVLAQPFTIDVLMYVLKNNWLFRVVQRSIASIVLPGHTNILKRNQVENFFPCGKHRPPRRSLHHGVLRCLEGWFGSGRLRRAGMCAPLRWLWRSEWAPPLELSLRQSTSLTWWRQHQQVKGRKKRKKKLFLESAGSQFSDLFRGDNKCEASELRNRENIPLKPGLGEGASSAKKKNLYCVLLLEPAILSINWSRCCWVNITKVTRALCNLHFHVGYLWPSFTIIWSNKVNSRIAESEITFTKIFLFYSVSLCLRR